LPCCQDFSGIDSDVVAPLENDMVVHNIRMVALQQHPVVAGVGDPLKSNSASCCPHLSLYDVSPKKLLELRHYEVVEPV